MVKKWKQFNEVYSLDGQDYVGPDKILEKSAPIKKSLTSDETPPFLIYLSTEIIDSVKNRYDSAINEVFFDLHQEFNTVGGDADFTNDTLLEEYRGKIGWNIIETTVHQVVNNMNISSISKSLKSDKINFQILSELKDERNALREGDEVILVTNESVNSYLSKINNYLIKVIIGKYDEANELVNVSAGNKTFDGNFSFSIDDCILVIKKETYEDFGGLLKLH